MIVITLNHPNERDLEEIIRTHYNPRDFPKKPPRMRDSRWNYKGRLQRRLESYYRTRYNVTRTDVLNTD